MPHSSNISLRQLAQMAGVSTMTVSRVLRNSPEVSAATRQRVLAVIAASGYQPDPLVAQLMSRVRQQRHSSERATLALVHDHPRTGQSVHNYVPLEHVRERAERHGYRVEPFRIGQGGVSPRRLQTILQTRGIRGLLLSVSSPDGAIAQLDFSDFAAVTFGFGLNAPSLHRTSTNITQGMLDAFARLERCGYRRIGVAITPWVDLRAGHTYSGALLHYQQSLLPAQRVPLLLLADAQLDKNRRNFESWLRKYRPDVLITLHQPVANWLQKLGIRFPQDIGLLVHDWLPSMGTMAGIDHRRHSVAAAAVDLLATHLQHHEYGIPEIPRQVLIESLFVDGQSLSTASA